jgi:hypothetical protein
MDVIGMVRIIAERTFEIDCGSVCLFGRLAEVCICLIDWQKCVFVW